jgi:hypothetical protein
LSHSEEEEKKRKEKEAKSGHRKLSGMHIMMIQPEAGRGGGCGDRDHTPDQGRDSATNNVKGWAQPETTIGLLHVGGARQGQSISKSVL